MFNFSDAGDMYNVLSTLGRHVEFYMSTWRQCGLAITANPRQVAQRIEVMEFAPKLHDNGD